MKRLSLTILLLLVTAISACGSQEPADNTPAENPDTETEAALPILYDFWAEWCPPCREQKPIIDELKEKYAGVVDVIAVNVDEQGDMARDYKIRVIPTLVFIDAEGNELERLTGLNSKETLVERFRAHGFIE